MSGRALPLALVLLAAVRVEAGVQVPTDVGVGPEALWFPGPLLDNRGAVPHFALAFNVEAVIDQIFIREHQEVVPRRYRAMANQITEVRVGPSIFIPSTLYVSPAIDPLGGVGMYGLSWTPIGLTLLSTREKGVRHAADLSLDAHALLTALFLHSGFPAIPPTFFLRPGLEAKLTFLWQWTPSFLVSLGVGGQVYVPQRLGTFLEVGPLEESLWLSALAFFKVHFRFPYEVRL